MSTCGLFLCEGKDMKKSLESANFDNLERYRHQLLDQRHKMENMLLECLQAFAFVGSHTKAKRKIFSDDFQHLIEQVREVEDMVVHELESSHWIACPECHGAGGGYYQDWEMCMRCWGHGKIRPEKSE